MRLASAPLCALLCALLCACAAGKATVSASEAPAQPPAAPRALLLRGTIHTLDPARPLAQAALIQDGRFTCVGALDVCSALDPSATVLDLGQGSATPGLVDAHGHVRGLGRTLVDLNLRGVPSEAEAVARALGFARTLPPGAWVRGRGWDQTRWPEGAWPTQASLTAALPDWPAWLRRVDGHAGWANARALALAGVDDRTQDPPGGRLLRDAQGRLTGVLIDAAMDLVEDKLPPFTPEETEAALAAALRTLVEAGFTSAHDMGISPEVRAAYLRLAGRDALPLRIVGALDDAPLEVLTPRMLEAARAGRTGRFEVRHVKLYADGALGSRGALLSEPYSDEPAQRGLPQLSAEELTRKAVAIAQAGLHPAVHCIGDLACAQTLRAFVEARRAVPSVRPRAEHLQVLHPRDVALLTASGAVASMQPVHLTSDGPWVEARLGAGSERVRGAYAWRQALDAGAHLACGSDFPIEEIDPRAGLLAAETRSWPGGPAGGFHPEQALTRLEALRCFTEGAAWAAGAEQTRGRIAVGLDADVTCFAKDVLAVPAAELATTAITCTIVGGRVEYRR